MFRPIIEVKGTRFNSTDSCDFLYGYEQILEDHIIKEESRQPSKTFAPSQLRCKRLSWFRLRGISPDSEQIADKGLNFTAMVGTAVHQSIQSNLQEHFGDDWIDVQTYMDSSSRPYKYTCNKVGLETQIEIQDPPIKFAPDGIIRYKSKFRLLEIKTSDYISFDKLTGPKEQHIAQVVAYGTLLGISDCLFLYVDRQYGNYKCYEYEITSDSMNSTWYMFREVQDYVDKHIAPPRLPVGDVWCTPSRCRYYNKCKEW